MATSRPTIPPPTIQKSLLSKPERWRFISKLIKEVQKTRWRANLMTIENLTILQAFERDINNAETPLRAGIKEKVSRMILATIQMKNVPTDKPLKDFTPEEIAAYAGSELEIMKVVATCLAGLSDEIKANDAKASLDMKAVEAALDNAFTEIKSLRDRLSANPIFNQCKVCLVQYEFGKGDYHEMDELYVIYPPSMDSLQAAQLAMVQVIRTVESDTEVVINVDDVATIDRAIAIRITDIRSGEFDGIVFYNCTIEDALESGKAIAVDSPEAEVH